jgi:hypothetical protein
MAVADVAGHLNTHTSALFKAHLKRVNCVVIKAVNNNKNRHARRERDGAFGISHRRGQWVMTGVVQVGPAHDAHGPMVERSKHLYHLRSQALVLSTKGKYVVWQAPRGRPVPCRLLCSPLAPGPCYTCACASSCSSGSRGPCIRPIISASRCFSSRSSQCSLPPLPPHWLSWPTSTLPRIDSASDSRKRPRFASSMAASNADTERACSPSAA